MSYKLLTTGYYIIDDPASSWYNFCIYAKSPDFFVRLLYSMSPGPMKWSKYELVEFRKEIRIPDLYFILRGAPLAID